MGQIFCKKYWFGKKEVRILMHGLDAAGKTTILYELKLGEVVTTLPTIGFNVETVSYKNINIMAWDVGGRCAIRPFYRHYYALGTDAILFVIDSNDRERLEEVRDELSRLVQEDELRDTVFLILANKQDLPRAMGVKEMAEEINFLQLMRSHKANIMGCTAVTGDGLYEALDWLSCELNTRKSSTTHSLNKEREAKGIKTLEKTPGGKEKIAWSFTSYMKGSLEAVKTLLPKLG